MQLIPLELIHSSLDSIRKAREPFLIDLAGTLEPRRMNRPDELYKTCYLRRSVLSLLCLVFLVVISATTLQWFLTYFSSLADQSKAFMKLYKRQFPVFPLIYRPHVNSVTPMTSYLVSRVCRSHTTRASYTPVVQIPMDGNECCKPRLGDGDDERSF